MAIIIAFACMLIPWIVILAFLTGRCTFCDEASKILHPPCLSGSYPDDGDDAVIHDYDVTDAILMYGSV